MTTYGLFDWDDLGAGTDKLYTFPADTKIVEFFHQGPGAGGGAGDATSAGGAGGSGAKNIIIMRGDLGLKSVHIILPVGGLKGIAPGGNGHPALSHSRIIFDNGWEWIAGSGNIGYGGDGRPGPGGASGNVASIGNPPSYIQKYGQFNGGSFNGGDGTLRLWGTGGNQGDAGGGGQGGWMNQDGTDGQGGYLHMRFYK